jgi:dephospho-CoA kinase
LRDPSSSDEIKRIIASQISREARLKHADDIIDNSSSDLNLIKASVIKLDQKYRNLATS